MRMGLLAGLIVIFTLPFIGAWARRGHENGCAFDGQIIQPVYRVRILDEADRYHDFCSVECAKHWLERMNVKAKGIFVADEYSGQEIPAAVAFFVRSSVVTMPVSGNRIHVFKNQVDAERHARSWRGRIVGDLEAFRFPRARP